MDNILYALLALLAGATAPTQAGINARLRETWAGDSITAAFVSFLVGTVALGTYLLVSRASFPEGVGRVPMWQWSGGLLGAFFVTMTVLLAWRLGATAMFALIITGQLTASLVLDHYGWLGYSVQPVSWQRILGVALLVGGVLLVRKG